ADPATRSSPRTCPSSTTSPTACISPCDERPMSNYHLQPADKPQALTPQALRSLRQDPVQGISRRTLLRRSIGGAFLLWLTEGTVGSIGVLVDDRQSGLRRGTTDWHT